MTKKNAGNLKFHSDTTQRFKSYNMMEARAIQKTPGVLREQRDGIRLSLFFTFAVAAKQLKGSP